MLENFAMLWGGIESLLTVENLLIVLIGTLVGIMIGAIPGIGSLSGCAILLPMTYNFEPTSAIVLLATIYYSTMFGGSISAILLNIPGDSPAVMTALDGYALARKGKAGKALAAATISSFIGGLIGMLILVSTVMWLARFGLNFGNAEMTTLLLLALVSISWLIGDSPVKGIVSTLIGALLGCLGMDAILGTARLNFGNTALMGGIKFAPLVIGAVGFSQVIKMVTEKDVSCDTKLSMRESMLNAHEFMRILPVSLRSGFIGTFVGVLPGAGATTSSFLNYAIQKKTFRSEVPLGEGAIEGIASSESANNAAAAGAFAPLLALGIPGSGTGSILLGGLLMWGLQPGPLLFSTDPGFAWGCIASLFLANGIAVVCAFSMMPLMTRVITISNKILIPTITVVCAVGSFSATESMYGLYIMFFSGIACYLLDRDG
ncbi:MAG: tripartite tricarboxylate transporter permease, partial [Pyramidobacter sp.]|nr:tripartite tricarboxylate transporter permease [Pyramidobacter sp.]